MRVAALYDIHGNLPALEAVIQEIRDAKVDLVVVGGDVVPGPMPRNTLERLLDLNIPVQFIRGNGEAAVLAEREGRDSGVPVPFRDIVRWTAQQLQPEHVELLAAWPKTHSVAVPELGEVLFCHATPRSDTEIFTRFTSEDRLLPVFASIQAPVVVCGHTHMQFDRRIGRVRVVNAGSVGMPFGEPGAYWLLLGPEIRLQHTEYDFARAAERIRSTEYPQAHDFAANNVLEPPTEREMLDVFGGAETN